MLDSPYESLVAPPALLPLLLLSVLSVVPRHILELVAYTYLAQFERAEGEVIEADVIPSASQVRKIRLTTVKDNRGRVAELNSLPQLVEMKLKGWISIV